MIPMLNIFTSILCAASWHMLFRKQVGASGDSCLTQLAHFQYVDYLVQLNTICGGYKYRFLLAKVVQPCILPHRAQAVAQQLLNKGV